MSSELKTMLNKVAVEDSKRKETEFEEGINRYKSLLLKLAKDKKLDIIISFEGTEQRDFKTNLEQIVKETFQEHAHLRDNKIFRLVPGF